VDSVSRAGRGRTGACFARWGLALWEGWLMYRGRFGRLSLYISAVSMHMLDMISGNAQVDSTINGLGFEDLCLGFGTCPVIQ
jgi:hypothetical protein